MARDPVRRRLSRVMQNERRKAERRLRHLRAKMRYAPKGSMIRTELERQIKADEAVSKMSTRGRSIEEIQDDLSRARNMTTLNEMTQVMAGNRVVSRRRGSSVAGFGKLDLKVFFAVTSDYAKGISRADKMDKILEGVNRDFDINLRTYEELLQFVRDSDAFQDLLQRLPVEGEQKYDDYRQLSLESPRYAQLSSNVPRYPGY